MSRDALAQTASRILPPILAGCYEFQLDRKGRVVLPAEWRRVIGLPFALTPGPDGRLYGVRAAEWLRLVEVTEYRDYYLTHSVLIESVCANTGRFLIPGQLRRHAGLRANDALILAGMGDCFRIMREADWMAAKARREQEMLEGDYAVPL